MILRTRRTATLLSMSLAGLACGPGALAAVGSADLARCAALVPDAERLACYDRLARRTPIPAGAAPTDSVSANAAPPADDPQRFGLIKPAKPVDEGPKSIQAVVGALTPHGAGDVDVLLDNGQTWTFNDSNYLLKPGDTVLIKRAALGSFVMSTPTHRSYRVRRLR